MIKARKIIWLISIGFYFALNCFIAIATQSDVPTAPLPTVGWPTLTIEVTNTTPDTLSAHQIFAREIVLQFPETIPSQQTKNFQFSLVGGSLRGFVFLYTKGKPSAVRLSFDGKTVKTQEFQGVPLAVDLLGDDCIRTDDIPACVWTGEKNVIIKAVVKYGQ